jgi:glycine/D-amino acid oxidase-like deaminating enzyme
MAKPVHPKLPAMDIPSGWNSVDTILPMAESAVINDHYDWLVVGAGFTGLAAARRLGDVAPDESVLLVDAKPVGWGASGRNSGFVIDLPHKYDFDNSDRDRLMKIIHLNRFAIDILEQDVRTHEIDCDWSRTGKLQGAVKERGKDLVRKFVETMKMLGEEHTLLERDGCREIMGTDYYAAAVFTPGSALVNPLALVRGLAKNLPENVVLADDTPVAEMTRHGGRFQAKLRSTTGEVRTISAKKIIFGVDPYLSEFGYLRNRILPVMTFASITRRLTATERGAFKGQLNWGLTPADAAGTTLRMTKDGRLLIRNHYAYAPDYAVRPENLVKVREAQRQGLDARYPGLAHVPFSSTWGGVSGLSGNHVSFFGAVADDAYAAGCYNGVGIAKGTVSGRLLVDLATGTQSRELDYILEISGRPSVLPPDPILGVGATARMKISEWESRAEL